MKSEESKKEVSPQDVSAFLNAEDKTTLIPEEDGAKLQELAGATAESRTELTIEPAEQEERIDVPADATFSPDVPTPDSIMDWAQQQVPIEDIELTEAERIEFVRAALFDKALILAIDVLGDHKIECRALLDYEIEVMYSALEADRVEGLIATDATFFSRMQNYGILMQVVSVDGKAEKFFHIAKPKEGDVLTELVDMREATEKLRAALYTHKLSAIKSAMFKTALRMFAAKMKLALNNIANTDFWKPAVAD